MAEAQRTWELLARDPHLAGVDREWMAWLGDEMPLVSPYLTVDRQPAGAFPCDTWAGEDCPRRVVEHSDGSIVAVCGNTPALCERLALSKAEIAVQRFDVRRFARDVASALRIDDPKADAVERLPHAWLIGSVRLKSRARTPVYLLLAPIDGDLANSGESLLGRHAKGSAVLITASVDRPGSWERPLADRAAYSVALPEIVRWADTRLTARDELRPSLRTWLEQELDAHAAALRGRPKPMGRSRKVDGPGEKRVIAMWRSRSPRADIVRETRLPKKDVDRIIDTASRRPENRDARPTKSRRKK